jgi:hypothetical protein
MTAITLRKAVELLIKDGDPAEVAVLRIRRALAAGEIESFGRAVGREQLVADLYEIYDVEQPIGRDAWQTAERVDWEHSAIDVPDYEHGSVEHRSRIILHREAFDRVFFPAKPEKPSCRNPPIAISEVRTWLDKEYSGKPRPRVHDLRAAAKAHDARITRTLLESVAAEKWPEPRRRGRPFAK